MIPYDPRMRPQSERHMTPSDTAEMIVAAMIDGDLRPMEGHLNSGGDPDLFYRDRSLIHWAAQESDPGAVRLLLEKGASTETNDEEGHFPLYQAAAEGSLETVRLMVEAGAVVNRVCDSGCALLIACAYEHMDVVRYLVEVGADPELPNKEGATARSISEDYRSQELLRILSGRRSHHPSRGHDAGNEGKVIIQG